MRADMGSANRPDHVPPDGSELAAGVACSGLASFFGEGAAAMARSFQEAACIPIAACRE
jgi:hypothetical protein